MTGLILGIAARTNLLALNATIEVAQAGEAGRSFAVVAADALELASQTAKAAETISGQVNAVQAIAVMVLDLRTIAVEVAAAMEQKGAVTQAIRRSASAAVGGAQAVTVIIAAVTHAAENGTAGTRVLTAARKQSDAPSAAVADDLATVQVAWRIWAAVTQTWKSTAGASAARPCAGGDPRSARAGA